MAKFKPYKIESNQLTNLPIAEGHFIVTTDTKRIYLDKDSSNRIRLEEIPQQTSAPSNPQINDLWIDTDDNTVSGDIKTSRSTSAVDAYSCSYINNLTDNIGNVSTLTYSIVRTWEA